ncbi:MAG: PIN domain-containing protein [Acidobacteriia bacterium]|jgi:uncharacterized protein|nr:PIN domain-containing protein [Terriglobia bacterium]
MSIFVDSSIWYAAADSSDVNNVLARKILSAGEELVTSDHILLETWSLLRNRLGMVAAERFWEGLRAGVARLEPVGMADLENAWQIGIQWRGHDFSLGDRTSFAVMCRLGIQRAASLDSDFAIFRYGPNRKRAFTVVR